MRHQSRAASLLLADIITLVLSWSLSVASAALIGRAHWNELLLIQTVGGRLYGLMGTLLLVLLAFSGRYHRHAPFWDEVRITWRYLSLLALANFAANFFVQLNLTRTVTFLAWLIAAVLLPVCRVAARELLIPAGLWRRRALVVGDGELADDAINALQRERHMGIRVAGSTSLSAARCTSLESETDEFGNIPAHLLGQEVEDLARQLNCEVIVVTLDEDAKGHAAQLVRNLHAQNFEVFVVPPLAGLPVHGMRPQHFFSNDVMLLRVQHALLSPASRAVKRLVDIVVASLALLVVAPLMIWVSWRIWREDGWPVVFTHPRVGVHCIDFPFFKFRSMVRNADQMLESWKVQDPRLYERYVADNFKLADDPRLLKFGAFIRRTSIDELPQLWNVLRGDMSLVGPRPLLRRELNLYPIETLELYKQVRPGITGLWQVSGRSQTSFEQRAAFDSWYVRNWSLWVDWVVMLKTVRVVLTRKGAA